MATVQGTVKWVSDEKKYGNYSFRLEEYDDEWFRSKHRMDGVLEVGNVVKLQVKKNKRGDFELIASPKLVSKAEPRANGNSNRNASIILQHSQEMAIAAASLLAANGAVKLAKTKHEANKVILLDLIDELTAKFYADANDPAEFLGKRPEEGFEVEEPEEADDEEFEDEEESEEDEGDDSDPAWD